MAGKAKEPREPRPGIGKPGHGKGKTRPIRAYEPDADWFTARTRQTGKPTAQIVQELVQKEKEGRDE